MKTLLIIPLILCGCTSQPHTYCKVVHLNHAPSPATVVALTATTKDPQAEIQKWFDSGERGFVINTTNRTAYLNAVEALKNEK